MKKGTLAIVAMVGVFALSGMAFANPVGFTFPADGTLIYILATPPVPGGTPGHPQGTTNGGEFQVYLWGTQTPLFTTFCIETDEFFSPGAQYSINRAIVAYQGGSGGPSPDPLSGAAGWLYYHFLLGDLDTQSQTWITANGPGTLYVETTNGGADLLQRALWFLEGEVGGVNNTLAQMALGTGQGQWTGDVTNAGPILVLRLTTSITDTTQDMLIAVNGFKTPEPGTILLLGAGLVGVAVMARRRRKA